MRQTKEIATSRTPRNDGKESIRNDERSGKETEMGGSSGIINLGAFFQAGFIILLAAAVIVGSLYVLWRWRNSLPSYQCRKCSGVFQTVDPSPMCPFCGGTNLYLKDLGGD